MNIFITGIAGFLGSHIAEKMINDGHCVSGCDNLIGGYLENVPKQAVFYQDDCCNFLKMQEYTRNIDVVYHCAATAYEGLSVFSPYFITKNIVDASVSVICASIQNQVKRFIFCSSMARYGTNKIPFTEDMIPCPQDPYGIGKVTVEKMLESLSSVHNMEYVIAVPHNIIGPRQKYDDPYRNVAAIMINRMLSGKQPVIYGDGNQKRCFSFVADDVWILNRLAFAPGIHREVFNIGPDEEFVTINELAQTIAELIGFDLHPIYVTDRPQEVKFANCSAEKIRKKFAYQTHYSLRNGLIEMIDYIRNSGIKDFQYHIDLEIINSKTPATWKEKLI